jgi:hypothetical protein
VAEAAETAQATASAGRSRRRFIVMSNDIAGERARGELRIIAIVKC